MSYIEVDVNGKALPSLFRVFFAAYQLSHRGYVADAEQKGRIAVKKISAPSQYPHLYQ